MVTNHGPQGLRERRAVPTGLALSLCLALACSLIATASPALSSRSAASGRPAGAVSMPVAKGVLLVASPGLVDPNFSRTVILICDHGPDGTMGLVLNRPTNLLLSEALSNVAPLQGTAHLLFSGGPVQPEALLMLLRLAQEPAQARRVMDGVYLGANLKELDRVITRPAPTETFRAFAGYAGWAPGQLASEMAQGSWKVMPGDAASIFEKNPADLWQDLTDAPEIPGTIQARNLRRHPSIAFIRNTHAPIPNVPAGG